MKVTTVILFLAFCGIASATLFDDVQRQRQDCDVTAVPVSVISGCIDTSDQAICASNCAGRICNYWNSQGEQSCSTPLGWGCVFQGFSAPSACMTGGGGEAFPSSATTCGALALVTIKGVLVAVLLLAAFFIL